LVIGCGDDPAAPAPDPLTGSWAYQVAAEGGGYACSVTSIALTFQRSGTIHSGTISATGTDNLVCTSQSGTQSSAFNGTAPLADVTLEGNNVAFVIGSLAGDWTHSGSVNGNTMSGSGTILLNISGSVVTLTGDWSAQRTN
jgi:hypothetical protein